VGLPLFARRQTARDGIGALKDWSLETARDRALELRLQHKKDVDPIAARKQERAPSLAQERAAALAEAKKVTFTQAAQAYLDAYGPSWKHRYADKVWWNPIRDYALPIIGDLYLNDIAFEHWPPKSLRSTNNAVQCA
jgi:hypothetical protein